MTRGHFKVFTIIVFLLAAGVIGALVFLPKDLFSSKKREIQKTKVVFPQGMGAGGESLRSVYVDDTQALMLTLEEDEAGIAVLTRDFNNDSHDDQVIAYRKLQDIDSPIYITYAEYDIYHESYYRKWNASTAASKPGTLILYSEDLIGDGGICVLVSGMNGAGEQTLTAFRKIDSAAEPFIKIAEFLIEGSIAVEEPEYGRRSQGRSLGISTYGRDYTSSNIMDQIEVAYKYNQTNGLYEQSSVVKIPGTQIEQMRVGELLNGRTEQFENFIDGLWYEGDEPARKYVYFDTVTRELIFYHNNSEEVFTWQNSAPTRYGIHINSWNVSLAKLRRTINVELISLESIRLRVYQDAYLRSGPNIIWDGSYQRLPAAEMAEETQKTLPYTDGRFAGQDGIIIFNTDGSYRLDPITGPSELSRYGQYVFFSLDDNQLLELRTIKAGNGGNGGTAATSRETFKINREEDTLTLNRIRIGTRGIQDLHEAPIVLQVSK